MSTQNSSGSQKEKKRGSWSFNEIKDLLDVWGQKKFQDALHSVHKNIDIFQEIAIELSQRGYIRTAEECRSKTKCMRLDFKKACNHNRMSGNGPKYCPFYNELENILLGDVSINPMRLAKSVRVQRIETHTEKENPSSVTEQPQEHVMPSQTTQGVCESRQSSVVENEKDVPHSQETDDDTIILQLEPIFHDISSDHPLEHSRNLNRMLPETPTRPPSVDNSDTPVGPETATHDQYNDRDRNLECSQRPTAALSPGSRMSLISERRHGNRRGDRIVSTIMQTQKDHYDVMVDTLLKQAESDMEKMRTVRDDFKEDYKEMYSQLNVLTDAVQALVAQGKRLTCHLCSNGRNVPFPQMELSGGGQDFNAGFWLSPVNACSNISGSRSVRATKTLGKIGNLRSPQEVFTDVLAASASQLQEGRSVPMESSQELFSEESIAVGSLVSDKLHFTHLDGRRENGPGCRQLPRYQGSHLIAQKGSRQRKAQKQFSP